MSEDQPKPQPIPEIPTAAPMLAYAAPRTGGMKLIARFGAVEEAEITAAELASQGIRSSILNKNQSALGIPYTGLIDVEVHVAEEDAARATEILRQAKSDDWEPAEPTTIVPPPTDSDGNPLTLAVAATFDSVRKMREAQTLLASARVNAFLPPIIPRGDRPAGEGKRFILRVAEDDLPRAQSLLTHENPQDNDPDDLHCPKCGSWRVYPVSHFWQGMAATVGLAPKPLAEVDCLVCRYRGPKSEFETK